MYILMVSHDCGCTYYPELTADTVEELSAKMKKLDDQKLRWYVENEKGEVTEHMSLMHAAILGSFLSMRGRGDAFSEDEPCTPFTPTCVTDLAATETELFEGGSSGGGGAAGSFADDTDSGVGSSDD